MEGPCPECLWLAGDYERLTALHVRATESLLSANEPEGSEIYKSIRLLADEAKLECEIARMELHQHQMAHFEPQ